MRKRKRQAVKKLIQCAAVIRGGMDVQPFAAVIPRLYEMPEK